MSEHDRLPDIVCDVDVPSTDDTVSVPTSWIDDDAISLSAKGVIFRVVSYPVGAVVEPDRKLGADEPTAVEVVEELRLAGYLRSETVDGVERFRLVHPDRLGPLPAV